MAGPGYHYKVQDAPQAAAAHFDIDQQLARVRNPAEVHVWVSPRRYNFETEFEVVMEDLLRSDLASNVRFGFGPLQRSTALDVDPFLTMAALVKQKRRASINNLRANFVKHKEDQGWTVPKVEKDRSMIKEGAQALELGRAISDAEYVDRLLEAEVLNEIQYTRIRRLLEVDNKAITRNEVFAYRRTSMELFYRQEITRSLIEADRQGRFRSEVRLFERLLEFSKMPDDLKVGLSTDGDPRVWGSRLSAEQRRGWQVALLDEVLSATPIWSKGKFLPDVVYSTEDLRPFLQKAKDHKRSFEGQFELSTRRDVDKKVTQHLGSILGLVGLTQASAGSKKQGQRKIYQYHLDPTRLEFVKDLAATRSAVTPWTSLNQRLGFKYSDDEIDWLLSRS